MLKTISYCIFFVIITISLQAQQENPCYELENKKTIKLYDEARKYMNSYSFSLATKTIKEVIDKEPEFAGSYYLLAKINLRKYERLKEGDRRGIGGSPNIAKKYLIKTVEACPDYDANAYYSLGAICFDQEEYDECIKYFKKLFLNPDLVHERKLDEAEKKMKTAEFYHKLFSDTVPFSPSYVKGVCSKKDEYLSIITPDNEMILFTRKIPLPPPKAGFHHSTIAYDEKFMYSTHIENNEFNIASDMAYPFNMSSNEGGASLTINNKELFYTITKEVNRKGRLYPNSDIYYTKKYQDVWTEIEELPADINLPYSWESQPTISSDGNTMYFASDRPGGMGGIDIYKVTRTNGEWNTTPENLGPIINTPGDEKSPFIHTDKQTLYFCSSDYGDQKGHPGIGGYDIFFSRQKENGEWTKPTNIGFPINSKSDDLGFFVSTDGQKGYIASNNPDFNGPGGWDLYSFDLYKKAQPEKVFFRKGILKNENTNDPINAKIEITNLETNEKEEIKVDTITGEYAIALTLKSDFLMTIEKEGYAYNSKYLSKEDTNCTKIIENELSLQTIEVGSTYKINDIHFNSDSFNLNNKSKTIIDGFIEYLKKNNNLFVEIHGHTDETGDAESNMELSINRAKSVFEYMIASKIKESRLKYNGFGQTKPVASNETKSGRAKNRRTEFVITGI